MSKRRVHEFKTMTDQELHDLIHECDRMERLLKAPHAKARRGWTATREQASAELQRRAS
jgi:hypothetical protein